MYNNKPRQMCKKTVKNVKRKCTIYTQCTNVHCIIKKSFFPMESKIKSHGCKRADRTTPSWNVLYYYFINIITFIINLSIFDCKVLDFEYFFSKSLFRAQCHIAIHADSPCSAWLIRQKVHIKGWITSKYLKRQDLFWHLPQVSCALN